MVDQYSTLLVPIFELVYDGHICSPHFLPSQAHYLIKKAHFLYVNSVSTSNLDVIEFLYQIFIDYIFVQIIWHAF